jgi:glucosamine kinase
MAVIMRSQLGNGVLLLGVDGGGTRCRARLTDWTDKVLGQAEAGPANIRLGLQESLAAVAAATRACLQQAGLAGEEGRIVACLALAGACDPSSLAKAEALPLPFRHATFTGDARAACVGAHAGRDGAIIIVGTGSVGWGIVGEREFRVGGWGFPLSDEGSGAWLGFEALRQLLRAHDGLAEWCPLLQSMFERFQSDAYAIVSWMRQAGPRDYAALAPIIVAYAEQRDPVSCNLIRSAAARIDAMAARLVELGAPRVSLMGGLSGTMRRYVSERTRGHLVAPLGDAVSGALRLARAEARRLRLQEARADA